MTESTIIEQLYSHFANYDYKLNNTFVFNWESDFFAMSKSGYYVECEVKVSRSDFFADFKKEKHRLFESIKEGKSHYIQRLVPWISDGDQLQPQGWINAMVLHGREIDTLQPLIQTPLENRYSYYKGFADTKFKLRKYIVNDWMQPSITIGRVWRNAYHAPTSKVHIQPMDRVKCPHQFYYAVPEGLITKEEVPPYAGLIVIRAHQHEDYQSETLHLIKKAPYLHKRMLDLKEELLKKYYNLWQFKVPYDVKKNIRKAYSETQHS